MIRKALILAAGMGTRLRPLTDTVPKALLEYRGRAMLEHVVNHLVTNGIKEVVINLHHHAEQIIEFVQRHNNFGISISFSDERDMLMDTGGAIIRARRFFQSGEPFLVHNVDIFSTIDLGVLFEHHEREEALATLAVRHRDTSRNLLVDKDGCLCGWCNNETGEKILVNDNPDLEAVAFSGIHILDPQIFEIICRSDPFSITRAYLELAEQHKIQTFLHDDDVWVDMAHPDHHRL